MKRVVLLALIVTLVGATPVRLAAGPLQESATRAAERLALLQQGPSSSKPRLLWTGAALTGAGVALITLSFTALKKSECTDILSRGAVIGRECIEETNAIAATAGLVLVAIGVPVTVVGILRDVNITTHSLGYRVRF